MDLFQAIERRHSYRGEFTDAPVSRERLEKIVDAGIRAPSGCNAQTTTFVIVDDRETLRLVGDLLDKPVVRTAQALVACIVDPKPVFDNTSFEVEDCAAAVENMLLAITALGYATVWLDGVLRREGIAEKIGSLLGVPEGKTVRIVLPIGVPAEPGRQAERKPFEERAWFNRYGVQ
jgi:nitroreductase